MNILAQIDSIKYDDDEEDRKGRNIEKISQEINSDKTNIQDTEKKDIGIQFDGNDHNNVNDEKDDNSILDLHNEQINTIIFAYEIKIQKIRSEVRNKYEKEIVSLKENFSKSETNHLNEVNELQETFNTLQKALLAKLKK